MEPFAAFLKERGLISPAVCQRLAQRHYIREPIGMIAVGHGLLNPTQIDLVLDEQRTSRELFGEIAVRMGFLTPEQVDTLIKIQEFRTSSEIAETLALSQVLTVEDAARHLSSFLTRDREVATVAAT